MRRGEQTEPKWLYVDPAASCSMLFSQQYQTSADISGVKLTEATKEAFLHFRKGPHPVDEIAELILHVDGGGPRTHLNDRSEATWAVTVCTRGVDGTYAWKHHFGGMVPTAADDACFVGAEDQTSMAAETSAQLHAGLYLLSSGLADTVPVSVIFDNETAAKFAMAVANSKRHLHLHAAVGTVWQVASSRYQVVWGHAYSHFGNPLNELVDRVVEYMAWNPGSWSRQPCVQHFL